MGSPAPGHERFDGYLSIPYKTPLGVRGWKFRCLRDHDCAALGHGKYDKPLGDENRIYNAITLLEDPTVVAICEGELDALVCSAVVGVPAVGVPGVSSWKAHHPRMFQGVERVVVLTDNDVPKVRENCSVCRTDVCQGHSPGRDLAKRICSDLEQAVYIPPPRGEDVTSWVLRDGVDAVRERLAV